MLKSPLTAAPLAAVLTAATLLSAPMALAQDAFDVNAMTPAQQDAFGEAVRSYLLENPEVIMEAVAVLEAREAAQAEEADKALVAAHLDDLLNDGFSHEQGNPEGDFTVVEFVDYRCGYCRRAHPEVQSLVEADGNIRLVLKEFPILGEDSVVSSRFAIATGIVAGEEAYDAVHDALITLEGKPGKGPLTRLAETLGLDAEAILAEMDSDEVTRRIAETRALAQALQINGTPSFVFGDEMMRGYAPLEVMTEIVAQGRANAN